MNQHQDSPRTTVIRSSSARRPLGLAGLLVLGLTLSLNACGSAGDAPTPSGAPTADSLSGSVMSGAVLETFAQTATPELQWALTRYASGRGFGQVGGPPLLGLLGGGVSGLSLAQVKTIQAEAVQAQVMKAQAMKEQAIRIQAARPQRIDTRKIGTQGIEVVASECTTVPGDQTDLDADGVLDDSTATYSCAGNLGFAYSYGGQWTLKDKLQQDDGAAYLFTGNSLGSYSLQQGLLDYDWTYAEKSSLDTFAGPGTESSARYVYNWDARGSAGVLGVAASFDLKWRMNLSLKRRPDVGGRGSTVTLGGQASAGNTQTGLGGFSDLTGTLHYAEDCGGFDHGSLNYTSGGSARTLTYTGCNTFQ
jgi:hypothetical protein